MAQWARDLGADDLLHGEDRINTPSTCIFCPFILAFNCVFFLCCSFIFVTLDLIAESQGQGIGDRLIPNSVLSLSLNST